MLIQDLRTFLSDFVNAFTQVCAFFIEQNDAEVKHKHQHPVEDIFGVFFYKGHDTCFLAYTREF
jgi:hypothetical protein